ncbi:ABC transporter ATP-binding protein [Oricola sp.]|uniref:ABC transporter ATP-binding protein n=1 Tax=Oricola sp. TaxID=1979950 RepID=UPI0025F7E5C9|nr:ABC transporter ATP-binding protein [Oricola sp.]MCI5077951.1 ABC transporter ATP-binding protein [Oricola sp.]
MAAPVSPSAARPASEMIGFDGVSVVFDTPKGQVVALDDVSFSIPEGEFASVIGPSGCGKTTIFNILGGFLQGNSGEIRLEGKPLQQSATDVGLVFQEDAAFPWRSALDNVAFPLELKGVGKEERHARAREFLQMVGLSGFEDKYPAELSGGMRQRVSLARTLVTQPKVLLMDEPFAALDEQTRLLIGDKITTIHNEMKQTTMLITHNITEAVQLSDRVLVMTYRPGRIKKVVEIDLPWPRTSEILGSEKFGQYVAAIWDDLRVEASRGLEAQGA